MSAGWLDEELPEAWPTHVAADPRGNASAVENEQDQSILDHIDATVAIQHVNRGIPQWKRHLSPQKSQQGNIGDLKSMFPDQPSMNEGTSISTSGASNASSGMPDYELSRKLKLFTDPDTYTEQRCDNLLVSLQGHPDNTLSSHGESLQSEPANTFANRSRGDVAARFLKSGENALLRIRKASMLNLNEPKSKKDESLDDLERKLANGTIDTTDDAPDNNSNGSTLSTLSSTDWVPDDTAAPPPPSAARQLTSEFVQEYSRRSDAGPPLTDQFGSMKLGINSRQPTPTTAPTLSSLSTVNSRKMRSATSSTVLHHPQATESMASTFVPTVQFASPVKQHEVSMLAIPGESSEEIEEHNLETKPSMAQVNDGSEDIVISTSEPSTEISGRSFTSRSFSEPLAEAERPRIRVHSLDDSARPLPPHAFDVTFRDGTMFERPMPSMEATNTTIGNLSIAQRDTTFSNSMYHLAELLSGKAPETLEAVDLSNANIESIKGLGEMLPRTRELNLAHNSIRVLEGLPAHAVRVSLRHNALNRLSSFPVANITTLDIAHNVLTDLRGLKGLRSLVHLDVSHNQLASLVGFESLPGLETLDISHNKLAGVAISHPNLRVLCAGSNPLKSARLATPQLEELDLDDALVTTVDAVPSVKRLSLRNNQAVIDFKGWSSLETLYYDGNDAARNCPAVAPRTVWWQGTNLTGFDPQMLRAAFEVVLAGPGLSLSAFVDTYPAQALTLCNTGLSQLPAWLPKRFPLVRSLNVAFNSLDESSLSVIAQFRNLEELSLFCNRFSDAGRVGAALSRLPKLRALDMRANPATQFYPDLLFNRHQPPMAAYDEVLGLDWPTMVKDTLATAEFERYRHAQPGMLQWLDGVTVQQHDTPPAPAPYAHSAHSSFSSATANSAAGTPARSRTRPTPEDRFASARSSQPGTLRVPELDEPDMTARGLSTPPRKDMLRQMAKDYIALYDLACRQHPDRYGPLSRYYVRL